MYIVCLIVVGAKTLASRDASGKSICGMHVCDGTLCLQSYVFLFLSSVTKT